MNDMFNLANGQYDEHEPTKCQKAALETRHQRKKQPKNQTKNASIYPNENADETGKLLAFSYLFVPLLFLGMKGRERKKKNKEQIIDVKTWESTLFCNSHTAVQEEHGVSGVDTQNIQS